MTPKTEATKDKIDNLVVSTSRIYASKDTSKKVRKHSTEHMKNAHNSRTQLI